jgi:hypothetical protein
VDLSDAFVCILTTVLRDGIVVFSSSAYHYEHKHKLVLKIRCSAEECTGKVSGSHTLMSIM